MKTADKLKQYIEKLAADLYNIKQTQDEEKKQLTALRDLIKSSLQLDQKEVGGLYVPSRANSVSEAACDFFLLLRL